MYPSICHVHSIISRQRSTVVHSMCLSAKACKLVDGSLLNTHHNACSSWQLDMICWEVMYGRHLFHREGHRALWSGTPCRTTSVHSRTMSSLDSAWKPGFSLDTSMFSALETLCYLYSLVKMDCGVLFNLVSFYVFFQCFDTVGWVIWPVKTRPHVTYIVLVGR